MRRILLMRITALSLILASCTFPIKLELSSSCTDENPATPCDDDPQAAELISFRFTAASNPGLGADVTPTISDTNLAATVPFGTNITALVATFQMIGASVRIGGKAQISGTTPNDFTRPVIYAVTAVDGTTKYFTVTVAISPDPSTACKLPDGAAITLDSSQVAANLAGRWWLCGGAAEFHFHVEFTTDQQFYMLSEENGQFVRNLGPTTSGTYSVDPSPTGISFSIHQLYQDGTGATYPLQGFIETTPRKLRLGGGYYVAIP